MGEFKNEAQFLQWRDEVAAGIRELVDDNRELRADNVKLRAIAEQVLGFWKYCFCVDCLEDDICAHCEANAALGKSCGCQANCGAKYAALKRKD